MTARIGDRVIHLGVDTGSDTHVLSTRLARELALPTHDLPGAKIDLDGDSVDPQVAEPVEIVLDGGWRVPQQAFVVADFPARVGVERTQLDGMLSPQLLAREGASVVIELSSQRMWLDSDGSSNHLATGDTSSFEDVSVCVPTDWGLDSRYYTVEVPLVTADSTVASSRLKLDTGRTTTTLLANGPQVASLIDAARVLDGHDTVDTLVASFQVGDVSVKGRIPVAGLAPGTCPEDGLLGLDVLARCTLVLGVTGGEVFCRPSR